jgi:hypothetical protein
MSGFVVDEVVLGQVFFFLDVPWGPLSIRSVYFILAYHPGILVNVPSGHSLAPPHKKDQ